MRTTACPSWCAHPNHGPNSRPRDHEGEYVLVDGWRVWPRLITCHGRRDPRVCLWHDYYGGHELPTDLARSLAAEPAIVPAALRLLLTSLVTSPVDMTEGTAERLALAFGAVADQAEEWREE